MQAKNQRKILGYGVQKLGYHYNPGACLSYMFTVMCLLLICGQVSGSSSKVVCLMQTE